MIQRLNRGDVYEANLDPATGSEQAGTRPVIVVQSNSLNKIKSYAVAVVIPMTAEKVQERTRYPDNVFIPKGEGGLTEDSVALCGQVRAISHNRLRSKRGELSPDTLGQIEFALRFVLNL
jgi:mRNA interferase MazF